MHFAFTFMGEWLLQRKAFCLITFMQLCWEAVFRAGASAVGPQRDASRFSVFTCLDEPDPRPGWFWLRLTAQQWLQRWGGCCWVQWLGIQHVTAELCSERGEMGCIWRPDSSDGEARPGVKSWLTLWPRGGGMHHCLGKGPGRCV